MQTKFESPGVTLAALKYYRRPVQVCPHFADGFKASAELSVVPLCAWWVRVMAVSRRMPLPT